MTEQNQPPIAKADQQKTQLAKQDKPKTLLSILNEPTMKAQIMAALPKHMTPERMVRIVTTELRKTPVLAKCEQLSFFGAVIQCAQLGLEPGNSLGHAYILPFEKKKRDTNGNWVTERVDAQLIIGYRGMIDLARRSGQIESISARTVREKDDFHYEYGLNESLKHIPNLDSDDSSTDTITYVYAVAKLKGGGVQFEIMSRRQIETVMKGSKSVRVNKDGTIDWDKTISPWKDYFEEMAKKTVIRRLFKYLPVSIEIQQAVILDEKAEAGISQDNEMVLDGEFDIINEGQPQ